ncbi:MAG: YHS domain-containing protein [candidate division Zixibacteria bacterium]|nr:YHS domain-containing protein [candidate division Zixibacteria bacterium]
MLTKTLLTIAGLLLTLSVAIAAADAKPADTAKAPELKAQTLCPVMGGKIDSTIYTDIQGQRVYLCCAGCIKPLKKDPDKYFKKAAADSVLFENVQTSCPVSGEELKEKKVYADHGGRRVYFCYKGCIDKFEKDPQKYLTLLDKPSGDEAVKKEKSHEAEHEGHNH